MILCDMETAPKDKFSTLHFVDGEIRAVSTVLSMATITLPKEVASGPLYDGED